MYVIMPEFRSSSRLGWLIFQGIQEGKKKKTPFELPLWSLKCCLIICTLLFNCKLLGSSNLTLYLLGKEIPQMMRSERLWLNSGMLKWILWGWCELVLFKISSKVQTIKKFEVAKFVNHASKSSKKVMATSSPERYSLWSFCWFCGFSVGSTHA